MCGGGESPRRKRVNERRARGGMRLCLVVAARLGIATVLVATLLLAATRPAAA